jgi:hypothetical protein
MSEAVLFADRNRRPTAENRRAAVFTVDQRGMEAQLDAEADCKGKRLPKRLRRNQAETPIRRLGSAFNGLSRSHPLRNDRFYGATPIKIRTPRTILTPPILLGPRAQGHLWTLMPDLLSKTRRTSRLSSSASHRPDSVALGYRTQKGVAGSDVLTLLACAPMLCPRLTPLQPPLSVG